MVIGFICFSSGFIGLVRLATSPPCRIWDFMFGVSGCRNAGARGQGLRGRLAGSFLGIRREVDKIKSQVCMVIL